MIQADLAAAGPRLGTAVRVLPLAARIVLGGALAYAVVRALAAPEMAILTRVLAAAVLAASLWRPGTALVLLTAIAPAGWLLAPPPARAAELFAWALLAGWLLRVWWPLAGSGWPRGVALPATLYAACAVVSWVSFTVAGAAGVDSAALGAYLLRSFTPEFLVFSTQETHTWSMAQLAAGVGVYLAAMATARVDAALPRRIAWTFLGAMAVLATATCIDVLRQWAGYDYDPAFLLRYTRGERFTLHLADLNAAGSQYVLAAGMAVGLGLQRGRRTAAAALLIVTLPAYWLTGSRTAAVALAGAVAAVAAARKPEWRISRLQVTTAAIILIGALAAVVVVAAFGADERGSAGRALRLRAQFSETSVRMLASAPAFGVGVGRYFARSPEFMPQPLRELYGAENAHNYFAQQFAELGVIGGTLFVWALLAAAIAGWRRARAPGAHPAATGLFAGCAGFLLTCVTGHPFLVSEAAIPFWIALGVLVSPVDLAAPRLRSRTAVIAAVAVLLVVNIGRSVAAYADASRVPPEAGFDRADVAGDGTPFRWTSPHLVTYASDGPGFLRVVMRAPDVALTRPVTVEISIAGRVVDRRALPRGEWVTVEIPVREPASAGFRRVDLRVTPFWTEKRQLGQRTAQVDVALGVMVAELRWVRPTT